ETEVAFVAEVLDDLPALAWGEAPPREAAPTVTEELAEERVGTPTEGPGRPPARRGTARPPDDGAGAGRRGGHLPLARRRVAVYRAGRRTNAHEAGQPRCGAASLR